MWGNIDADKTTAQRVFDNYIKQHMNNIRAILDKSDYEIYDDYLNFMIDDFFLDERLDERYSGNQHKGLVPTENAAEKVGSNVDWFDKIKPLTFDINNYGRVISDFKGRFEEGKRTLKYIT